MRDLFEQQLNLIKSIEPDKDFAARSRQAVLSVPKPANGFYYSQLRSRLRESFNFALAIGLTAIIIYVAFGVLSNKNTATIAEKSKESAPGFDIHLSDARYYKEIAPNVFIVVFEDK